MTTAKRSSTQSTATRKKADSSIEFSIIAPEASEVYLVGDFNDWNAAGSKMRKFKDGSCKKKVQLKPGRYEYLFLVDGTWKIDPTNESRCINPFGSENSVIQIGH
ncbi:MAG: isoamylase early set domain-containing protein [Thermodesulfobacteriota bacterium]